MIYKKTKMMKETISVIGLGGWNFGGGWDSSDERNAISIVHAAIDQSVHCRQSLYNMLERNPESYHGIAPDYRTEDEVLPTVKKYGQAFLPYSPLFQGLLAGKFSKGITFLQKDIRMANPQFSGGNFEKYRGAAVRIEAAGRRIGRPINEIAFNRLRRNPEVTCIIAGASSVEQLQKNVKSVEWDLDDMAAKEFELFLPPFVQKSNSKETLE
jgi:aryl-alcohol dehydrogenase-like predicted oxidoreductase